MENQRLEIKVAPNGPLLINGNCIITDKDGKQTTKDGTIALCRCGQSKNKPYCDGSHKQSSFDK